ncbi:MAG: hypothetical protein HUJ51_03180 [Eggerthellaceae bacterium]|nr:hypothetical protein [Eggerthellaceae bacterium]
MSIGSLIANLPKSAKVIVKPPHEAVSITAMGTTKRGGFKCTKQVINMIVDLNTRSQRLTKRS